MTSEQTPALPMTRGARVAWAAVAAAVCVAVVLRYGATFTAARFALLAGGLVAAAASDAATYRIPNGLVIAVLALWAVCAAVEVLAGWRTIPDVLLQAAPGAVAAAGPALLMNGIMALFGKEGFGGGDIKLLFAVGLFFPWQLDLIGLVIACVVGAVIGLVLKARNGAEKLPFGCGIAAGWIALMLLF